MEVDSPDYEARDASALIDWLAKQPEAQLDKAGDPRVGMNGSSYGGGIQWITAARDARVDVITPNISWNSLITSLYKDGSLKAGWGIALCGLGLAALAARRADRTRTGSSSRGSTRTCSTPASTASRPASISPADQAWYAAHGPDTLLSKVKIPTLITQGTADTLFTLKEAIRNYALAAQPRRADEDALVLRRPRRLPDRRRRDRPHRARGAATGSRATSKRDTHGADRPALRVAGRRRASGARRPTTRSRGAGR